MGLAASQARLLLLTARRSDLEYRAQMISQRKIALAMETEQIANEYTRALNNRKLEFTYQIQENNKTTKTVDLSYRELLFGSELSNYRVVDQNGNIRVQEGESMTDDVMLNAFDWYVEGVVIDGE